jgi:hypothetical protein
VVKRSSGACNSSKEGFRFQYGSNLLGRYGNVVFTSIASATQRIFAVKIDYVAGNPGRRRLTDYPFVHTNYPGFLDAIPHAMTGLPANLE